MSRIEIFSWLSIANLKKKKKNTQDFSCKIAVFYEIPVIFFKKTVVKSFYKNYIKFNMLNFYSVVIITFLSALLSLILSSNNSSKEKDISSV